MITYGSTFEPNNTPKTPPINVALNAYKIYLAAIVNLLYPNAFIVPMSVRSSSIIRVIVVRLTNAATRKKINGSTLPMAPIRSASIPYSTLFCIVSLPRTYHFPSSNSINCFSPSAICSLASSSFRSFFSASSLYVFQPFSSSSLAFKSSS